MRINLIDAARQGDAEYENAVRGVAKATARREHRGAVLTGWRPNPRFESTDPADRHEAGYRWIAEFEYPFPGTGKTALATYGVSPDGTARCWAD